MSGTSPKLYWEDFEVDRTEAVGAASLSRDEIIAFARHYDPQPFHIDEVLAKDSFLGALCASGWHVAVLFSKIIYQGYEKETALIAAAQIEECRWRQPVFPDDRLTCRRTCLAKKDGDRAGEGLCQFRWDLFDQKGEHKTQITGWSRIKKRA